MGRRGGRGGPQLADEDGEPVPLSVAGAAAQARIKRLEADWRIRAAALVGYTFHLDPAELLAETDPLKREVRVAAHNVVQSEERKRQPKTKGSGGQQS